MAVDTNTAEAISTSTSSIVGKVIAVTRGFYEVETASGSVMCVLRGKLRKQFILPQRQGGRRAIQAVRQIGRDPVSAGDQVEFSLQTDGTGVIERILERASGYSRTEAGPGRGKLQTLVAGLDQIVAVFAARDPEPHLGMLDRFLVLAEAGGIGAAVCINKVDLGVPEDVAARLEVYRSIGYQVVMASAELRIGFAEIQELLAGKTSAFVGPSGVGKSSLLRGIEPAYDPRVLAISEATGKGRHTTTGTRLFPLSGPSGGYLADTAGLRELAVSSVAQEDLAACFREFQPFLGQCHMPRCTHIHEPNCAIRGALSARKIDPVRYRSYRRMRAGSE